MRTLRLASVLVFAALVAFPSSVRADDPKPAAPAPAPPPAAAPAPDDSALLKSAADLVAWFDARADKSRAPETLQASVEKMRKELTGRAAFDEAYRKARSAFLAEDLAAAQKDAAKTPTLVQRVDPAEVPKTPSRAGVVPDASAWPERRRPSPVTEYVVGSVVPWTPRVVEVEILDENTFPSLWSCAPSCGWYGGCRTYASYGCGPYYGGFSYSWAPCRRSYAVRSYGSCRPTYTRSCWSGGRRRCR